MYQYQALLSEVGGSCPNSFTLRFLISESNSLARSLTLRCASFSTFHLSYHSPPRCGFQRVLPCHRCRPPILNLSVLSTLPRRLLKMHPHCPRQTSLPWPSRPRPARLATTSQKKRASSRLRLYPWPQTLTQHPWILRRCLRKQLLQALSSQALRRQCSTQRKPVCQIGRRCLRSSCSAGRSWDGWWRSYSILPLSRKE